MDEKRLLRRHIVLIDDVADTSTTPALRNPSSLSRLSAGIRTGSFIDAQGRAVEQHAEYYQAVEPRSTFANKFGVNTIEPHEQQIRDIVLKICKDVKDPADEIFIFGAGHGADTVRAVAETLHYMGIPKGERRTAAPTMYEATLNLIKSRGIDDSRNLQNFSQSLRADSCAAPNIQFVGLLDALQPPPGAAAYSLKIASTVRNFRHALAFNENRASNDLALAEPPDIEELVDRSFVQAWFLGSHSDIVGGTQHDGLSIYALQWMMIEAMLAGLVLSSETTTHDDAGSRSPLALAFPKHAGHAPDVGSQDESCWHIRYRNGMDVRMFDVQSIHVAKQDAEESSHSLHLENPSFIRSTSRKIFSKSKRGLSGYDAEHPSGTIIHPSVFCILHRTQRFLERRDLRAHKDNLASFEADCLQSDPESLPPWQNDSELLASGVKAFRILVCGKTGVGKSTLINRTFGVEIVRLILLSRRSPSLLTRRSDRRVDILRTRPARH
jgi:hypothetical protein